MAKKEKEVSRTGALSCIVTQPMFYSGATLIEQTDDGLTIQAKRPRSSKSDVHYIPAERIAAFNHYTDKNGDERIDVVLRPSTQVYDTQYGTFSIEGRFVTVTDEEGNVYYVASDMAEFVAEAEDEEDSGKKGKAKGKKAADTKKDKKGGKKAKDEDEEEEEEDEDEDEEEEEVAPKKGKKVGKKGGKADTKKGGKKGKKAKDEDEEEEDEDEDDSDWDEED